MSPTLTLYRSRCGRWPGGPDAQVERRIASEGPWWGSQDDVCEACLRSWASSGAPDTPSADDPGAMLTWVRRRPGLVWHLLIPTWRDADPALLPHDAQPSGTYVADVTNVPEAPLSMGAPIRLQVKFHDAHGVKGGPRLPGESDEDVQRRHGLIP